MEKKIYIIIFIILLSVLYVFLPVNYIDKDDKKIYVRSKGKAKEWNGEFFDHLLRKKFPDKEIVYNNNISNPDIFLISHFSTVYENFPYISNSPSIITWSGEPRRVNYYDKKSIFNFISQKPQKISDVWWPFLLTSHYETKESITKENPIEERKNLVAYIASNCRNHREKLFSLLKEKSSTSHALGKCSNNHKKADGMWSDLTNVYKNYIFGFAMENCDKEGYITEKIWNVYKGGAIPIFWGDSKSAEFFFNKETYIDVNDFKSFKDASDYIFNLSLDKKRLKEIKSKPIFKDPKIFKDINYAMGKVFSRYREEL